MQIYKIKASEVFLGGFFSFRNYISIPILVKVADKCIRVTSDALYLGEELEHIMQEYSPDQQGIE